MNRSILVPLDGSFAAEQAIALAARLAAQDAEITLLTVVPAIAGAPEVRYAAKELNELQDPKQGEALARTAMAETMVRWSERGVQLRPLTAIGDPASEILRAAEDLDASLIVMTSHGRGTVGRIRFGSVSDRVARTARIPVAIVVPDQNQSDAPLPALKRVIVPLDGSELALQSLPFAKRIAKQLSIPVDLVQAIDPVGSFYSAGGVSPFPAEWYREAELGMEESANGHLSAAAQQLVEDGVTATTTVIKGQPAAALLARIEPDDLVVITSHGRGGLRRWLIGSVAEKLVRHSSGPVVLIPNLGG
jgi:nucleotide-binding universal stress UspA family protein